MAVCKKCRDIHDRCASGQAFREFTCAICGNVDIWHNTDTPKFCEECSRKLNICQRCGATLSDEEKEK